MSGVRTPHHPPFTIEVYDVILRPAFSTDLRAIARLHIESWRSAYAHYLPAAYLGKPVERDLEALWARLDPADLVIVAEEGCRLTGFAAFRPEAGDDGPLLDNLHVAPDRRGRGIGAKLLEAAVVELAALGETRFWLTVIDGNQDARRFYRRMGGQEGPPFGENLKGNQVQVRKVTWRSLSLGLSA